MTPDQITALARKLANDLYNDDRAYNSILWWCEEPKERKAEELEHTLRFLLRRYCLVEKSKVESVYNTTWNSWYHTLDVETKGKNQCVLDVLHFLFPEIAKEVEL